MRVLELASSIFQCVNQDPVLLLSWFAHRVLQDHGVPQNVIDCIFDTAKAFFDLPLDVKSEIHFKKSKVLHGYEGISEVLTDESKRADLVENFNCGYEPDLDPAGDGSAAGRCHSLVACLHVLT